MPVPFALVFQESNEYGALVKVLAFREALLPYVIVWFTVVSAEPLLLWNLTVYFIGVHWA